MNSGIELNNEGGISLQKATWRTMNIEHSKIGYNTVFWSGIFGNDIIMYIFYTTYCKYEIWSFENSLINIYCRLYCSWILLTKVLISEQQEANDKEEAVGTNYDFSPSLILSKFHKQSLLYICSSSSPPLYRSYNAMFIISNTHSSKT